MREDFLDDPRFDDAAVDFALVQLCKVLGVDPESISWDAATETFTGDVQAVIGNILRTKYGEDWGPDVVLGAAQGGGHCGEFFKTHHVTPDEMVTLMRHWQSRALAAETRPPAQSSWQPEEVRKIAADAIRTFCKSLGSAAVQMSHGEERIYYAGISLEALSAAVALALSSTDREGK